jgi:hypothetical protein
MYKNKLVACVKVKNKILKEDNAEVFLPFKSKYSIYLKNENKKTVIVNILINNKEIYSGIIIKPKEKIDVLDFKNNEEFIFKNKDIESSNITVMFKYINNNLSFSNTTIKNDEVFMISLKLNSFKETTEIYKEITNKDKKICFTCNKKFKNKYNFCPFDGTLLKNTKGK